MKLDARKIKILQAIIMSYLETAEPVGSRTISKNYDLGISSATIRNEMADLEELGLILQPYTSAGRIPSDSGYRLYVDFLMKDKLLKEQIFTELLSDRFDRIEALLQDIAKILALQTNYATVVTTPQYKRTKLKKIQLIILEHSTVLCVIVIEGNIIKNHILHLLVPVNQEIIDKINLLLKYNLEGLTLQEINLEMVQTLKKQAGIHSEIINGVLDAVINTIQSVDEIDVYTSGTQNILKCPEFSNIQKAAEIIDALQEKQNLISIINDTLNQNNKDICILIGNENSIKILEDCSLITTTYSIGEDTVGAIGIIGPKRMDYEKVVSMLKQMMYQLDKFWNKT